MRNLAYSIAALSLLLFATDLAAQENKTTLVAAAPTPSVLQLDLATFLGGKGEDRAHGMAVDGQGNIYLTGPIDDNDFPVTSNALVEQPTGLYFAKLDPRGAVLYSTYLGVAVGNSYVHGVALDKDGCIYLAGNTTNPGFATTPGAFQTAFQGPADANADHGDAFIVKLSPEGDRIVYSTFLGGSGSDICGKIAVDSEGNAYVLGCTASANFPVTPGAFQTAYKGGDNSGRGDLFVAKLNPDGSKLVYCTYIGGLRSEIYGNNIVLDATGSVFVSGTTTSSDFPVTANALQKDYRGGSGKRGAGDAVVLKLNPIGTALEYSTYIGSAKDEHGTSLAVDGEGNIWLAGDTTSGDFPTTPDASCRQNKGGADCFIAKIDPQGGPLLYASLLGGGKTDNMVTIGVNSNGSIAIAGRTESPDFPVTSPMGNPTIKGTADLFVVLFDPFAKSLRSSVLLGGGGNEVPGPLVFANNNLYLSGNTTATDFPVTTGATDTSFNGGTNEWGGDIFVARFLCGQ